LNKELEDFLLTAKNKLLEQAEKVRQTEMQASTPNMMDGLGGLFGK
jgi:DNA-binding protein YbaB